MRRGALSSLSLFFAVVLPLVAKAQTQAVDVGVIIPLTGTLANWGVEPKRVMQILTEDGFLSGLKYYYRFLLEDGQCGVGNSSASAAHKLIDVDGVKFIFTGCSGELMQVGPIAERAKVLTVGFACSHPKIRELGDYIFRVYPDIRSGVEATVNDLRRSGKLRLAVLTEETSFTAGIRDELRKTIPELIISTEDFPPDETDFRALLTRVKAKKPDSIFVNSASPDSYELLFKQLRGYGLFAPVYAYFLPADSNVRKSLGNAQDGVKFFTVDAPQGGTREFEEFYAAYQKRFGAAADGESEFLIRRAYDGFMAIIGAVEAVGPDPTAARNYLYRTGIEGSSGTMRFDEKGDIVGLRFVMKQIVNGDAVDLKE